MEPTLNTKRVSIWPQSSLLCRTNEANSQQNNAYENMINCIQFPESFDHFPPSSSISEYIDLSWACNFLLSLQVVLIWNKLAAMKSHFPFTKQKNILLQVNNKIVYCYFTRHQCKMIWIGLDFWCKKQFSFTFIGYAKI